MKLRKNHCQLCRRECTKQHKETVWCKFCEDMFNELVEIFTDFEAEMDEYFTTKQLEEVLDDQESDCGCCVQAA